MKGRGSNFCISATAGAELLEVSASSCCENKDHFMLGCLRPPPLPNKLKFSAGRGRGRARGSKISKMTSATDSVMDRHWLHPSKGAMSKVSHEGGARGRDDFLVKKS